MKIEIWSDILCPFCYIGKRRMEKAIAKANLQNEVDVEFKSFLLNPNVVTNPNENIIENLAKNKGWSIDQANDAVAHVLKMAAEEGLNYDYDNAVLANSFNAHRLLQFANTKGKGIELKELLMKAHFVDGKNIDDCDTLVNLAGNAGLPVGEAQAVIEDEVAYAEAVQADINLARNFRIQGVPFFVFDRKYGISGAQPLEAFTQTLEKVMAESSASAPK